MKIEELARPSRPRPSTMSPRWLAGRVTQAFARVVRTTDAVWPTLLRVAVGSVMLSHALQKTLGLFGGDGFSKTVQLFDDYLGLPAALAVVVILLELIGSIGLLLGLLARAAALCIGAVMLGAIGTVHFQHGLFMNWSGKQSGEGFEYHLLVLAMVAAILIGGSGRGGLDRSIARRLTAV